MRVMLFCGGMGMRLREYSESIPKPMVEIGYRPILWHVMKYYAFYGHSDFVLCLGYKADVIKNYFLNYNECVSNDFVLSKGSRQITLMNRDIDDWTVAFVDTGLKANIGQRMMAARKYLDGDEMFMANYADGLTDLPLQSLIDHFNTRKKIACFVAVQPRHSFHVVALRDGDEVAEIQHVGQSGMRMNGGFFIFRKEIFDYMREGEELVNEPFHRLIQAKELVAYTYDGFWASMDTFKDKQELEELFQCGNPPWQVWSPAQP